MRAAIRERGAVPAVTAVVRGVPVAGLDDADLERFLARIRHPEGLGARPAMGDGPRRRRRHDRRRRAVPLRARRPAGVRHGRNRRRASRAPRRRVRRVGRPARALAGERRHGLRRREVHPRPARHGRAPRDARRHGRRVPHRRVPGVLHRAHRPAAVGAVADSAADIAAAFLASRALGRPGALLVVQPPPAGGRARRARSSTTRSGGASRRGCGGRDRRPRAHAIPARRGGARDRRPLARGESRPPRSQRRPRRRHRRGVGRIPADIVPETSPSWRSPERCPLRS